MKEKIIKDPDIILKLIHKSVDILFVKYNEKNKRAFYSTDNFKTKKSIDISRVIKYCD